MSEQEETINRLKAKYHLTDEKIAEHKYLFEQFDVNGDGDISYEELQKAMKGVDDVTEEELREMMLEVDDDENGTIEFTEFLTMMGKRGEKEARVIKAFAFFDKDKTGFLSASQLCNIMHRHANMLTPDEIEEMVQEADSDQDGFINYKQFVRLMMSTKSV